MQSQSNLKFNFSSVRLGAVTSGRRLILHRYYSPASYALRVMLRKAKAEALEKITVGCELYPFPRDWDSDYILT